MYPPRLCSIFSSATFLSYPVIRFGFSLSFAFTRSASRMILSNSVPLIRISSALLVFAVICGTALVRSDKNTLYDWPRRLLPPTGQTLSDYLADA